MTRLIDADKAERDIEELRKSDWFNAPYLSKERKIGISEAFDMIQSVCIKYAPPVDAIPIEWINHYMDTELTKGSLFYSCMSEFMRDWKKEQEKANDSFDKCG